MALKSESLYPSRRTYVLKLRSDADVGALAGLSQDHDVTAKVTQIAAEAG